MPDLNIEESIADELAKQVAAEIDFGIMSEMMIAQGWHRVQLDYYKSNKEAIDIHCWAEDNAKGKFIKHGVVYVFQQKGDAINFALKWA